MRVSRSIRWSTSESSTLRRRPVRSARASSSDCSWASRSVKDLEQEASGLLNKYGRNEQDPQKMASAFSWLSTEMKMMFKDDNNQIAKIMMNGCNMGIQSISEDINKYSNASSESVSLAKKLVKADSLHTPPY